jgi:hypothetical protein
MYLEKPEWHTMIQFGTNGGSSVILDSYLKSISLLIDCDDISCICAWSGAAKGLKSEWNRCSFGSDSRSRCWNRWMKRIAFTIPRALLWVLFRQVSTCVAFAGLVPVTSCNNPDDWRVIVSLPPIAVLLSSIVCISFTPWSFVNYILTLMTAHTLFALACVA